MQKPIVLLVEDNGLSQHMASVILENFCEEVICASSCKTALDAIKQIDFDLIIVDIGLPDMDGFEFIRLIRQNTQKHIPIIGASSYVDQLFLDQAKELDLVAMLEKPLSASTDVGGKSLISFVQQLKNYQ